MSCYQPPSKRLSSEVIPKSQPVRAPGTSPHMLTILEAPACPLAISTGEEGGCHKTTTRTSQLPKLLGPKLQPQIIVLEFKSRAYGKREHLMNHSRKGVARGWPWPADGVAREGCGQRGCIPWRGKASGGCGERRGVTSGGCGPWRGVARGVWPEEGRGHRRVWSDEGHGLHVRPVTSHHHNHAPPFDIRSWLKAKGELVLDDLDPAASYRPVGKCPGRVWLAQRTLRKEPTFPTFSHPGQAAPRNGLDHSKSKQQRLPRAASWAQQTSANLLPQDHHLERCFQNYYP